MDLTGARVGLFEVWGPIGEGGMSRVWLARHRELSVPVVLKTLRDPATNRTLIVGGTTGDADAFGRLRNEARLMARIPSPRVVRAVDVGVHEGCAYLAQEYVDGIDLAELDRRRRAALGRGLPLWFVCHVACEIADALHSAHQTGVVHRDVKPSNLFGSPQTGIRLGDFGIAVTRGLPSEAAGTLRFVAPETLRGQPPTRAGDVYSLGATAYDLFYGRPPFTEIGDILAGAPLVFPAARTAEEAYFQHVLACMLERDPARRLGSASAVRRRLAPIAQSLRPQLHALVLGRGVFQLGSVRITCVRGDIAEASADAIINSANDEMTMRSGVGGALRRKGGDAIEREALDGGRRALGECIVTGPAALRCRYVLHAVSAWKEASCIARTCQRALLIAEELGLRSLAIPALGTGVARVAPEACAYAAASALYHHVLLGGSRLRNVEFVLYDEATLELFIEELAGVFVGDVEPVVDVSSEAPCAADDPSVDETVLLPRGSGPP